MSPNLHFVLACPADSQSPHSENRATGVAFTLNPLFHPGASGPTETRTVRGKRLVVLSAGSFGSPGILERSGIGAKGVLETVGVKQRVDLPGVGENYQGRVQDSYQRQCRFLILTCTDHNILFIPCFSSDEAQTFDAIFRNDEGAIEGVSPNRSTRTKLRSLLICSLATTAEFENTGKGLIPCGYADVFFFHLLSVDDHNVQDCRRGNQMAS